MHHTTMETYYGYVRTPADAIKLFEACRLGLLPRVQRRLSEKERQAIRSGSVFVWDEREAGMRRWTDGKSWSASRVSGSFLTYREMEGKRGSGFGGRRGGAGKTPDSGRGSDEDQEDGEPDGYRYKADGLMKQSFSITTSTGQHLHLISYFNRNQNELQQPTTDPNLRGVTPSKHLYPESSLNETPVPALTRAPMQQQPYPPHPHSHPNPLPGPPHAGYPPHYQQPYWPPSPVATPPYSHGHYAPAPQYPQAPPPQLPPPHHYPAHPHPPQQHQHQHQQHQHPHPQQHAQHAYAPGPPQPPYDRAPLPPLQPSAKQTMPLPQPYAQPAHSPHMSQPPPRLSPIGSPRSQALQAQAREAVQIDPRLASTLARSPQLLPPTAVAPSLQHQQQPQHHHQNGGSGHTQTPPSRALSVSPPRSSHSDAKGPATSNPSNRASLQALLHHPTPANSEPNSANPGSAGSVNSSPGAGAGAGATPIAVASQSQRLAMEDARTLSVLDKKFCI